MYKILLLLLLFGLDAKPLYHDAIRPTRQEISRCMPGTFQSKINAALVQLEKIGKAVKTLNKAAGGAFKKNCKSLANLLEKLDIEKLFDRRNLSKKINQNKKSLLLDMFENPYEMWEKYLRYLNDSDRYLSRHVRELHFLLNKNRAITLVELMQKIDSMQIGVLTFSEMFEVLVVLDFARQEIKGYDIILSGMKDQLFVISSKVNAIASATKILRGSYINLLDKGDCSGDHIAKALGLTHKKRVAIDNE